MPTTDYLTADELLQIVPEARGNRGNVVAWIGPMNRAMAAEQINTNRRVAAFIGQVAVETTYFHTLDENSGRAGDAYFRRMYEGKTILGNNQPGDGVKFHGRGAIQITGRWNYSYFARTMRLDLINHPEMLLNPEFGFSVSARYWTFKHCNPLADRWSLDVLTHHVNTANSRAAERKRIANVALPFFDQRDRQRAAAHP